MEFFELNEEQRDIQQIAAQFARDVLRPAGLELDRLGAPAHHHPKFFEVLEQAAEIGFHRLAFPSELGGLGADLVTIAVVAEELAFGDAGFAVTLLGNLSFSSAAHSASEQVRGYVRELCEDQTGRGLAAGAMTEPGAGSDAINFLLAEDAAVGIQTRARRDGAHWVLDGRKCFITNGGIAKYYSVVARTDEAPGMAGIGRFVVPAGTAGLSFGRFEDKLGWRSAVHAEVVLDGVRVPLDHRIAMPVPYPQALEKGLGVMPAITAAVATGVARAAYELARQYAGERVQGGRALREHQAIALELAQMSVEVEAARAAWLRACLRYASGAKADFKPGCAAKVFCSDVALRTASAAVDVLGGYGCMKDFAAEKLLRDAKVAQIADGVNDLLRLLIGARL